MDVPASGNNENATFPNGHDKSFLNGGVGMMGATFGVAVVATVSATANAGLVTRVAV